MPADLTNLDILAFAWFLFGWAGYNILVDRHPRGINRTMRTVREAWMRRMLGRENRVMDSMLLGHLIGSVSFFASATVLLLAGLVGSFAAVDELHRVITDLGIARPGTRAVLQVKLLVLGGILIYAFFKFTWALRQFNYTVALVGGVPPGSDRPAADFPSVTAALLSLAVSSFNAGLRAYYFAFAALGWLLHPAAFMLLTAGVILVQARRQLASPARHHIRRYAAALDAEQRDGAPGQSA